MKTPLYQYMPIQRAKSILQKCEVWFTSPLGFNDPFDLQIHIRFPFSQKAFKRACLSQFTTLVFSKKRPKVTVQEGNLSKLIHDLWADRKKRRRKVVRDALESAIDQLYPYLEERVEALNDALLASLTAVRVCCLAEERGM